MASPPADITEHELRAKPHDWHGRRVRVTGLWQVGFEQSSFAGVWLEVAHAASGHGVYRVRVTGTWIFPEAARNEGYGHLSGWPGVLRAERLEVLEVIHRDSPGRDRLTGLPTRLDLAVDRDTSATAFAMIDLDHFKRINDAYGYLAGDQVLKQCAAVIVATVGSRGRAVRWGGEEVGIVFFNMSREEARDVVEDVLDAVRDLEVRDGEQTIHLTVSAGVAGAIDDESIEQLAQRAEEALYRAKAAGRDRVACYGANAPPLPGVQQPRIESVAGVCGRRELSGVAAGAAGEFVVVSRGAGGHGCDWLAARRVVRALIERFAHEQPAAVRGAAAGVGDMKRWFGGIAPFHMPVDHPLDLVDAFHTLDKLGLVVPMTTEPLRLTASCIAGIVDGSHVRGAAAGDGRVIVVSARSGLLRHVRSPQTMALGTETTSLEVVANELGTLTASAAAGFAIDRFDLLLEPDDLLLLCTGAPPLDAAALLECVRALADRPIGQLARAMTMQPPRDGSELAFVLARLRQRS